MSRTSLIGAFALGRQAAKDSVASSVMYLPTTSIGLNMNQPVQTLPPEIGGDYFLRESYKPSVSGAGDVSGVARANTLGALLYAMAGTDTVTAVGGQAGAYSHAIAPFTPAAGVDLPWWTLIKDVAKISNAAGSNTLAEQYLNGKCRSFTLSVPKSSIATFQSSWLATTPSGVTGASLGAQTMDTSSKFVTCSAAVSFTNEVGGGGNISANAVKVERFTFTYNNSVSDDEFSVGNYYLEDVTLLQRTVSVDMDFVVRDSALWQAVYLNGNGINNAWVPNIYRGALTVTLTALGVIPTTTQNYTLTLTFPGLDFMMLPIQLSGSDLVRATLQTQVTLGPSGADRFNITLINGIASY